jgi:sigma-B regulation protein RsbU (phosphoserine phosphatase)
LLVSRDGHAQEVDVRGLALGVDSAQTYEENGAQVDPGGVIVIYTDGVVEARRDGELYGLERMVKVVSASLGRAAADIANAVIEDCRSYAGDLADDCALVVIKRSDTAAIIS